MVVRVEWPSLVGLCPGGPFGVDVVAGGIRCLVRGGWPLVVGGVWGWSARWLPSHTLVLLVHGGFLARWGKVVGSGSGGGGVGGAVAGAAGGGGAGNGGDGAAGMALRPLVDIPVPLVGVGGRASCAVPGAVLFAGRRGRVRGRA